MRLRSLVAIPFFLVGFLANSALLYADTISLVYRVNVFDVFGFFPTPQPPPLPPEFFLTATFNDEPWYDNDISGQFPYHQQGFQDLSFSETPLVELPPPSGANPIRDIDYLSSLASGLGSDGGYFHVAELRLENRGSGSDLYSREIGIFGGHRNLLSQPPLNPLDFGTISSVFAFRLSTAVTYGSTGEFNFIGYTGVATFDHQVEPAPVPEPASLLLLGSGLGAIAAGKLRRRRLRFGGRGDDR